MDTEKAIFIFGLLGLGLLFLLSRSGGVSDYSGEVAQLPFKPMKMHHYTNEEVWDLEWNEDGLPTRITIHRNAVQT